MNLAQPGVEQQLDYAITHNHLQYLVPISCIDMVADWCHLYASILVAPCLLPWLTLDHGLSTI